MIQIFVLYLTFYTLAALLCYIQQYVITDFCSKLRCVLFYYSLKNEINKCKKSGLKLIKI